MMKLRLALIGLCVLALAATGTAQVSSSPLGIFGSSTQRLGTTDVGGRSAWQLPWPYNTQHRINGGNTYGCGTHTGGDLYAIDFAFARDDPVSAVAAGAVVAKGDANDGYGVKVVVDHGGGYTSLYAHLNFVAAGIAVGAQVAQGQTIGYADSTGNSTGNHLHLRVQLSGAAYKPEPMSGVSGFGSYGACTSDPTSPYWTSHGPIDDIAVWRPSNGTWYIRNIATIQWGLTGDIPVPADYDGDGDVDPAVYRPGNATGYPPNLGVWYIYGGSTIQHGLATDIPVPADYDGDGTVDLAVWRPSNGTWYIRNIATIQWGLTGDIPVPADYDGDGDVDPAVYRPGNATGYPPNLGVWYIYGGSTIQHGLATDIPVPDDYDGQ